jgi:protein SCO1/2
MTARRRILIILLALIPILAAGAFTLWQARQEAAQRVSGKPAIGGPFRLTAPDGRTVTDQDVAGRPYAIFFGFTHCPDVCPTTLFEMSQDLAVLGEKAETLRVLFVSVDPQRDTPELLAAYLQSFDPRIVGLTGTPEQIADVAKAYKVFYEKVPTEGDDYTMNHTATVYLMDRTNTFFSAFSFQEPAETRRAKLERLLAGG